MMGRKALASLAALGLALAGVVATPGLAQTGPEDELDDAGLWLMGGFVVGEVILVAILASDDDEIDAPPPPVSP